MHFAGPIAFFVLPVILTFVLGAPIPINNGVVASSRENKPNLRSRSLHHAVEHYPHARRGKDDELFQYARLVDDDEGVELERDVTGTVEKIKGDGPRSSGGSNAKTLKEKAKKIFSMGLFKGRKSDKVSLLDDGHRFEDVPSKSSPKIKGGSSGLVKPKSDTVLFVDGSGQQPSMGKIKAGANEEEKVKLVDHMVLTKGENQKEYDRLQEEKRRQELIDAIENAGIV